MNRAGDAYSLISLNYFGDVGKLGTVDVFK